MTKYISYLFGFIAVFLAGGHIVNAQAASNPVERYETPGQAPVNSWWVDSADGGVLVFDAQRSITDANAAVAELRERGHPIRALFITHPHPDHVTGSRLSRQPTPREFVTVEAR